MDSMGAGWVPALSFHFLFLVMRYLETLYALANLIFFESTNATVSIKCRSWSSDLSVASHVPFTRLKNCSGGSYKYPSSTQGVESGFKTVRSKRTTRSQSHSAHCSPSVKSASSRDSGEPTGGQSRNHDQPTQVPGTRKRKQASDTSGATLTDEAVLRLDKPQKMADLDAMVKHWVESACWRRSNVSFITL
jgi:hypothetical protein